MKEEKVLAPASKQKKKAEAEPEENNDDWITPENINTGIYFGKEKLGPETHAAVEPLKKSVGVLTSDFAMQNVILQIGIPLFSPDGVKVDRIKQFVLRCRACKEYLIILKLHIRLSKNQKSEFCGSCGNHTLEKVTVNVGADGTVTYGSFRRKINLRGTIV